MKSKTVKKVVKKGFILMMAFSVLLSNVPIGGIEFFAEKFSQRKIVDSLWLAQNDKSVVDSMFVSKAEAATIAQYTGGLLVYADGTIGTPKYRTYDNTNGFDTEQSASSVGASAIEWIRVAASPTNDEWIIATRDAGDVIKAQVCTGVSGGISCGSATTITATAGTHGLRNFDVAYERSSGHALLVYGTATVDELRKIEWTGSWGNDAAITTTRTTGAVEWVELTSRAGSDQIGIAYSDTADNVSAYRWSGTAVGDEATGVINSGALTGDVRKFDVSFEGTSGDMLVVSWTAATGTARSGQLVGNTWTIGGQTVVDVTSIQFLDLSEPNPSDNEIAVFGHGVLGASNTSEGWSWNGTGASDTTAGTDLLQNWAANYQLGAVTYGSTTYYGVAVHSSATTSDDIDWWTMNSASAVTNQTVNTRTRGASRFIDVFDFPNQDKVLLLTADANSDLWADTWAGSTGASAWTDLTSGGTLEGSLATATTDVVDFAFRLAPFPTTTLGDGTDGANSTIGPGDSATEIDRFSLVTSAGTDTVTGLTVTLAGDVNAYTNIATVSIQTQLGGTQCSVLSLSSNTVPLTSCGISVTTTPTDYIVKITPKSHGAMPSAPGASYATTATVTSITATNTTAGTDTDSATITVDNASPGAVTSTSGSAGDSQVTLNYTTPADTDLNSVVVLRRAGSAVADVPVEGTTYTGGETIGTATVATGCVDTSVSASTADSCTATGLSNGTSYYFSIFTKDSRGNYYNSGGSPAGVEPTGQPFTPAAAAVTTASTTGSQTSSMDIPSTNQYVGGAFSFSATGSVNVTGITLTESGTVNGQTNLDNIKLYYENDTSAPYDCASESYGGGETQLWSTDTNGFSGANGTSDFSGSGVGISTTSTLCVYTVLDVTTSAAHDETIEISIASTNDYTVSTGTKSGTPAISGTTTLNDPSCASVSGSANWNTGAAWDCGHVPATGNTVTIDAGETIIMDVNSAVLGDITVNGTLNTSNGSSWALSGTSISIGASGILTANASTITLSGTSGTLLSVANGGSFSHDSSHVVLSGNGDANINSAGETFNHLTSSGTGTKLFTGSGSILVSGNLIVSAGTLEVSSTVFQVSGTTSISGTFSDTNSTGENYFIGLVTINSGGVWNASGGSQFNFRGGLTNDSSAGFTSGSGTYIFYTSAQTLSGSQSFTITNLTNNITAGNGLTISGAEPTVTALTQGTNAVLTFSGTVPTLTSPDFDASGNTVQYTSGSAQTIKGTTYHHLTKSGAGTATLGGTTTLNGNLTVSAGTLQINTPSLTVSGTTSITGTIDDDSTTGTNLFTGLVTINNGGTWTSTGNEGYTFEGGLTVNSTSTLTSGSGVYTFDTNAQSIGGAQAFTITNLTSSISSGDGLTIPDADITIGTLTQDTNAVLTFSGTVPAITTLTANASGNTIKYTSDSAQTVKGGSLVHLSKSGAGVATLGANTTVNGSLTISAGTLQITNYDLTVSGSTSVTGTFADDSATGSNILMGTVTINSGGIWNITGNDDFNFRGGLTNNSSSGFTSGSGVYSFSNNPQTVSGSQAFTITNVTNNLTSSTGLTFSGSQPTVTTLTQGADAVLTFSGTVPSVGGLVASSTANTVQYTGSNQSIIDIGWSQIGSSLDVNSNNSSIAGLSSTDIAFVDDANQTIRKYRFNGSTWSQVGNSLALGSIATPSITSLGEDDIAFIDGTNDSLRRYTFNGTDWVLDGNGLAISTVTIPAVTALDGTDVAFIDFNNDSLRTYRFDGTNWSQVGESLAIATVGVPSITALNSTDIAFIDNTNDSLRTYRFNGSTWSQVGSSLAISTVGNHSITALNSTDIAFFDVTNDTLRMYRFNGSTWSQVGGSLAISGPALTVTVSSLDSKNVAYYDTSNDSLRTYRPSASYNDLVINSSGTASLNNGGIDVDDLTISGGTLSPGSFDINIGGNYSNSGTFTAGTGTVIFDAGDTGNTITGTLTGSSKFNNLVFNNSAGAWTLGNNSTEVGGNLTITSGALTAPSTTLTIGGDFTNTPGTAQSFVHNSGTVVLNTTTKANIFGDTTFNNLTAATGGKTVLFGAGDTFVISGSLTLTGASYNSKVNVDSTDGRSRWFINNQGTENITFVYLSNSGCHASSADITMGATSVDGSNNDPDCWIFPAVNRGGGGGNAGGESSDGSGAGNCADGIQNGNETGVDQGGRCAGGGGVGGGGGAGGGEEDDGSGEGTCADGIQNGNETGVDSGGRCAGGGGGDSGFLFDGTTNFVFLFKKVASFFTSLIEVS